MDQKIRKCNSYRPACVSTAFMFGILLGCLISNGHKMPDILISTAVATLVFHYVFVKNFNFKQLINKVIKKGS